MSGNGHGKPTTIYQIMAEHDALHPDLRFLSCYAVTKWAADGIDLLYGRALMMGAGPRTAVAYVAERLEEAQAKFTRRDYGPTHPEASPSRPRQKSHQ
jgi:hypothetical protein